MPESKATEAFTSVMGRLSTPAKPSPVVPPAGATKAIPQTRVGKVSTPRNIPTIPAPSSTARRKAMIGAATFVLMAGGAWAAGNFLGNGTREPAPDTSTSAGQVATQGTVPPAAATPTALDVDVTLAEIERLTNSAQGTPADASIALARLDSLPPEPRLTADQRVQAALLRAEANVIRGNNCEALRTVQRVEGDSRGTKYQVRVKFIIDNATC
jgi:hypothetical protein